MELLNAPTPVPSEVLELFIVGLGEVFQQTPFSVIAAPPSEVIVPPQSAELKVILVNELVLRLGAILLVVNIFCSPYTVPALLVAYALT
jgi:hypothetical protein